MIRLQREKLLQGMQVLCKTSERLKKYKDIESDQLLLLLMDCQELLICIGTELEEHQAQIRDCEEIVKSLEQCCEQVYQLQEASAEERLVRIEELQEMLGSAYKQMEQGMGKERKQIVFFPYKASMWDCMESIWKAADADEACEALVVPIPYYDRTDNGGFGRMHYEGNKLPDYVPILSWEEYDLEEEHPEVVYIHNPYDDANLVTSVHPDYYSKNIRPFTDCLVYVPYYATSGAMGYARESCPAYEHADYIIMQAPKYRKFFDKHIPDSKLLALGSPKFDHIIQRCQNPGQPPKEWERFMEGKKVYFYNTSITGMLRNTKFFLEKMEYVFRTFQKHKDACILWRPHPLLESTFDSMRPSYKEKFQKLKAFFLEKRIGIYDETPAPADAIAFSDAYIGDEASSITALFGLVGKPLFILDNWIHSKPEEGDWRGEFFKNFDWNKEGERWLVAQGSCLYHREDAQKPYRYLCKLSEYNIEGGFSKIREIEGRVFVCPKREQRILEIADGKICKEIVLDRKTERGYAFADAHVYKSSLILVPFTYEAVVRYDVLTGKITYYEEGVQMFCQDVQNGKKTGGSCIYQNFLLLASPVNANVLAFDLETGKVSYLLSGGNQEIGCSIMIPDGNEIWMLPMDGTIIKRWNPLNGETKEYPIFPERLVCKEPMYGYTCKLQPFGTPAVTKDYLYLPPMFGNMFVQLDKKTGEAEEWKPSLEPAVESDYFSWETGCHFGECVEKDTFFMWRAQDRKAFVVDVSTGECTQMTMDCDLQELKEHEAGFGLWSVSLQYCAHENAWFTLPMFLKGETVGNAFDKEGQMQAFLQIASNGDGTSGEKIHQKICQMIQG